MPDFAIFGTDEFTKRLKKLHGLDAEQIRRKLQQHIYPQLRDEPFFGPNIKKLRGYTPDTWRYRIGDYRLFYMVDTEEHVVYILTLDLRRDAYRR